MLLTVQEFLKRRPDMEVHMENAIQSAINSSFILLDGECAGLISQVQAYKESGENDTNNEYYRNDFEISQLIEALTSQTQYSLNLGNDYSIGGGSYSIGNINSSYNRPEGRDIVAPGVYKLLSNARVYNLNVGIGVKQNQDHYLEGIDPADKHISFSKAEANFVSKYQPNAAVGNVAYVNQSKMVSFSRPQDLQIGTYNTNRIAGGEGHRNNYYEIDSVPNIAFFGNNDRGTYSAIERGEVKQILNDNYLTKDQVFRVVYASGILWNSRLNYERGWISQEVVNNVLYWYEALENNTNKRPSQNPSIWKKLETQTIDINAIFNQIQPYIDQEITEEVGQQLLEAINNLPTLEYVEQNREQVLFFNSEQDFTNFKNETGTTDRDYETLPFNATPTDYEEVRNKVNTNETNIRDLNNQLMLVQGEVDILQQNTNNVTTNTAQTITGAKTFTNEVVISKNPTPLVLKSNETNNNKSYIVYKSNDNTTNFSLGANSGGTSIEVNRGDLTIQTQQANKVVSFETSKVKLNRAILETGTNIYAGFGGGVVKFIPEDNSTKTLQFFNENPTDQRRFNLKINEPTEATNPATKNYVDSQISNIQIPTNAVTTNTSQTISGAKTFSEKITISKTTSALEFRPGQNQSAYLAFYNGDSRVGYFGKGSSSNNNLVIGTSGKVVFEAPQGIEIPTPKVGSNPATKGYVDNAIANINSISLTANNIWSGDNTFNGNLIANSTRGITTDNISTTRSDRTITLKAGNQLGNLSVADPTSESHSANKRYVDNAINELTENVDYNQIQINDIRDNLTSYVSIRQVRYSLTGNQPTIGGGALPQEFIIDSNTRGLILPSSISIGKVLNITLTLPQEQSYSAVKYYSLSYCAGAANRGGAEQVVVVVKNNGYTASTLDTTQIYIDITLINN